MCDLTEHLSFCQGISLDMLWINSFDEPFEHPPGKRKPSTGIILDHQLSLWGEQSRQTLQHCFWVIQVMEGIRRGNQVERVWLIRQISHFSSLERGLGQMNARRASHQQVCLGKHLSTSIHSIQFCMRDEMGQLLEEYSCSTGDIQDTRRTFSRPGRFLEACEINKGARSRKRLLRIGLPTSIIGSGSLSLVVGFHLASSHTSEGIDAVLLLVRWGCA